MNPLAHIAAYPLAHALGWTLLHFCWQGAAVAALLWCMLGAMGQRSSQTRYAASCFALALIALLPLLTFARLAIEDYRLATLARSAPIDVATIFVQADASGPPAPWPLRLAVALDHSVPWVLALWLAGVVLFLARLTLGLLAARRMRSTGTIVSPDLQHLFRRLCARLGIHRAVRLLHSASVQVPTVIGWLRPVVLLPVSCLSGLSPSQIEALLCHELAHVRRHDYLVSVIQSVVETLLFYHPAVWWVSKQVRRERECCCDELALLNGGDVLAYARALSWLEEQRACAPQLVLGANGGVLTMRIRRLLGYPESSVASQFTSIALLAALALSGVAVLGRLAYAESAAPQPSPSSLKPSQITTAPQSTASATPDPAAERHASTAVDDQQKQRTEQLLAQHYLLSQESAPPAATTPAVTVSAIATQDGGAVAATVPVISLPIGVLQGNLIHTVDPVYPPIARAAHVQGVVVLHARISKEGTVEAVSPISGAPMLQQSAVDAVRQWTFKPYLVGGQPVAVQTTINVNFTYGPPDLSCTYYENGRGHDGTCEQASAGAGNYSCRANDDQGLVQSQVGCEWKVKRLEESQHDSLSPAAIQIPVLSVPAPSVRSTGEGNSAPTSRLRADNAGNPVRTIGGSVLAPEIIHQVNPDYTPQARKAKFMGTVLVGCIVNEQGIPEDVHIVRGVGLGLNDKAMESVKQYKFKPAMENGVPVPVELNIEVNFQIF